VAEVDARDHRQLAVLGLAMVGSEVAPIKGAFEEIIAALRAHPVAELIDHEVEV